MRASLCTLTACVAVLLAVPAGAQTLGSAAASEDITGSIGSPSAVPALARSCATPGAIGVGRVVEIDTLGGPGFGLAHFAMYDFLRPKEVVLTFDDGVRPETTPAVLDALARHCTQATFFPTGKHALHYPQLLNQVAGKGHTIGSDTWSHADLSKLTVTQAKDEIEKGFSAVRLALAAQPAPFFRFPNLAHAPEMIAYLAERNIGIFSTDIDVSDTGLRTPEQVTRAVMTKLEKPGKGIILLHDSNSVTARALPSLLHALAAAGYKVVHMKAKDPAETLAEYDTVLATQHNVLNLSRRATAAVVHTIAD